MFCYVLLCGEACSGEAAFEECTRAQDAEEVPAADEKGPAALHRTGPHRTGQRAKYSKNIAKHSKT